jgi:MFS family permease
MTQNALLTFLPLFLARELGYSVFLIGASMFALQAAGFAAAPVAGHLSDKFGRRSVMVSTMAMTAVVLVFMAVAGQSKAFIGFIAVLGFFLYAIRPVIQAWLLEATPKNMGGSGIGILFGAQSLGSSIAPLIGGLIADRYGLGANLLLPRRDDSHRQPLHPAHAEGRGPAGMRPTFVRKSGAGGRSGHGRGPGPAPIAG